MRGLKVFIGFILFLGLTMFIINGCSKKDSNPLSPETSTTSDTSTSSVWSSTTNGIYYSSGYVGIGTSSPSAYLEIEGENALVLVDANNNNSSVGYQFRAFNSTSGQNEEGELRLLNTNKFVFNKGFYPNETNLMTIDLNSGNVGIGTTNPIEKLEVYGGNIRVTGGSFIDDGTALNVPDYVFEDDYPLKSIEEVEKYIKKNKHLEGLPDAKDTQKWAEMSMQERDMKLLEKIEELTLYIIQLNKRINELEKKQK